MALITVGSTALHDPISYEVTYSDVDSPNSTRGEDAKLHRERIRAGMYKIQSTFKVNNAELKTINDAVAPVEIPVTFFDAAYSSEYPTKTMYVGDRTARLIQDIDAGTLWELSFSFIEV